MERLKNRISAGKILAKKIKDLDLKNPLVIALPRGGVPVASEIADLLKCPLDLMMVKKLGAPQNPELAIGAVTEDGSVLFNRSIIKSLSISKLHLENLAKQKTREVHEQTMKFRGHRQPESISGKDVVIVDDGLATGATMLSALRLLRKKNPHKIIVAVPVAAKSSLEKIAKEADDVICLMTPTDLIAVAQWYEEFDQVSDSEVQLLLSESRVRKDLSETEIFIEDGAVSLSGDLTLVPASKGLIIFAHGSGSGRKSPRNQFVASELNKIGLSTLLFDLLSEQESQNRANVFNISLLTRRLMAAIETVSELSETKNMEIALFGASTGAGAALMAAAQSPKKIFAVVSRGGRPDLALDSLKDVTAPVLLIVGGDDPSTLAVNKTAAQQLKLNQIVIIPGATHLFEEHGALDEVVEHASAWFLKHLRHTQPSTSEELVVTELKRKAVPFRGDSSLDALISQVAKSRIVMLGEATHGTHEFYSLRRLITQKLIQEHGFNFIAVEGDWPDTQRINRYIKNDVGTTATEVLKQFSRWPTWMWANQDVALLVEFLKKNSIPMYGLDVYSLFESIDAVRDYVQKKDLNLALTVESAYSCLDPFQRDEKVYAKHLLQFPEGCRREVTSTLRKMLRLRVDEIHDSQEALMDAKQNARIVANAEDYYRRMLFGGPDSWNARDHHMLDTLDMLLKNAGSQSKCVVWAHNSHIGDYHATDMAHEGYVNLGGLARERFGVDAVSLVGFGTYQGQVLASHAWEGKEKEMPLPKAKEFSFEAYCHKAAMDLHVSGFSIVFDAASREGVLGKRSYGHRAVGVVYDPKHENRSLNYVPTIPAQRYDGFVFVDQTSAIHPMKTKKSALDLPETWPGGI